MHELFVPGRLCLFGEHSDWAAGYRTLDPGIPPGRCLVAGMDQGLRARASPLEDAFEISSVLPDGRLEGPVRFPLDVEALDEAARGPGFFRFAAGVAAEILARRCVGGGVSIAVTSMDLPLAKGLSSSAAACVLVARAFSAVHGLRLDARAEMELAHAGERRTGSACGRMDQVCALGRVTTSLTFDGEAMDIEALRVGADLHLVVADLKAAKDTGRILADLNRCYPAAGDAASRGVREALGPMNLEITSRAREALEAGDARALGACMTGAQDVFDRLVAPASPALESPRLHAVLEHPAVAELAWGGKGVGSQGDGCAQLVARGPGERRRLAARLEADLGVACLPLTLRA